MHAGPDETNIPARLISESGREPPVFITYDADTPIYLSWCSSHFFPDDLAAVAAGGIGTKVIKSMPGC